jgi:hypothetical protein
MYSAKSFEQSPRNPSSSVPNWTHFNLYLNPPPVGARYIVPQKPAIILPRHAALTYPDSVPIPYHFRTKSISLYLPASPHLARLYLKTPRVAYPFFLFTPPQLAICPQSKTKLAPRKPAPPLSGILPAPTLAHPRLYFRAKGDSYDTD